MASTAVRISKGILERLMESDAGRKAAEPYREGEDLAVTVHRHLGTLNRQSDGSVTVTRLTADELRVLRDAADRLAAAAAEGSSSGLLRSATIFGRYLDKALAVNPPLVSSIGTGEPETAEIRIEQDPLVAALAAAEEHVRATETAHEQAVALRRRLRRLRDEKIAHCARDYQHPQLGKMFDLHPSQVSRIISAHRDGEH